MMLIVTKRCRKYFFRLPAAAHHLKILTVKHIQTSVLYHVNNVLGKGQLNSEHLPHILNSSLQSQVLLQITEKV